MGEETKMKRGAVYWKLIKDLDLYEESLHHNFPTSEQVSHKVINSRRVIS